MPHDDQQSKPETEHGDLSDLLSELRILLPGTQMLTAFLIILPFNGGFAKIDQAEKIVFLATFIFSMSSLVLLSAPAIGHRIMRPLTDRERFKRVADRIMMAGALCLALAFILGTNLVMSEVFGHLAGLIACALMAVLIAGAWWALPWYLSRVRKL